MRRRSRECALPVLYQGDVGGALRDSDDGWIDAALVDYWANFDNRAPVDRSMVERLVRGVTREITGVDAAIAATSDNWRIERMGAVERNLMRVATFEILHCPDIPRGASINEALEIAKRFGSSESVPFINGVLDRLPTSSAVEDLSES